jgi:hypothetical protein
MFGYTTKTTTPKTPEEIENSKKYAAMLDMGWVLIICLCWAEILFDSQSIGAMLTGMFVNSDYPALWGYGIAMVLSFTLVTIFKEALYMCVVAYASYFLKKKPQNWAVVVLLTIVSGFSGYGVLKISANGISAFSVSKFVKPVVKKDESVAKMTVEELAAKKIKDAEDKYAKDYEALSRPINSAITAANQSGAKAIAAKPKDAAKIRSEYASKVESYKNQLATNSSALLTMKNQAIQNARLDAKNEIEKVEEFNKKEEQRYEAEVKKMNSAGVVLAYILMPVIFLLSLLVAVIGVTSGHIREYELKKSFFTEGNGKIAINSFKMIGEGLLGRVNNMFAFIAKIVTPKEIKNEDAINQSIQNKSSGLKELARGMNQGMDRVEGRGRNDWSKEYNEDSTDDLFMREKKR